MHSSMSMKRFRRVAELWNWLPAFRGVAEHESIHGAATVLGISASALSRTVRLLEEALGTELFVRQETGLKLTPMGTDLLTVTRDAMRLVDDCIATKEAILARRAGPVFVGVTSALASAAAAHAVLERRPQEPLVIFDVRTVAEDAVEVELLRGNLDIAVCSNCLAAPELTAERLADVQHGVYAAKSHPLSPRAPKVSLDDLGGAGFVASRSGDGWPEEQPRRVAVFSDSLEMAVTLCAQAELVCVLPDALATLSSRLVRLCDAGPPLPMYAVRRKPLPNQKASLLDDLVDSLRRGLAGS